MTSSAGLDEPTARRVPASVRQLLAVLFLCALGYAGYRSSLDAPFVHDDLPAIVDNPRIRSLWPFGAHGYEVQSTEAGRPVVRFTLALNHALGELGVDEDAPLAPLARALGIGSGGLGVRGYHVLNLALHVLSALVLMGVVRRTLALPHPVVDRWRPSARLLSVLVAGLWLIHPLQTDSVTYVIQRTELLMGLFYLATLYCSIRALDSAHRGVWAALAVLACALGMGSKEVMVSAPLVVALYDRAFVFATWRQAVRHRWPLYAGLGATMVLMVVVVLTGPRDETVGFGLGVAWWEYAGTQLAMILHYLRLTVWPAGLCLDYGRELAPASEVIPGALVVGGLLAWTLRALVRRPAAGFLGAWFFLILAPSSSVVPIVTEVGAERRMHLPLAALIVAFVLAGERLGARLFRRAPGAVPGGGERAALAGTGAVLMAVLCVVTARRNAVYASDLSIWLDTVGKRPTNSAARNNLGRAYALRGRFDEAYEEFLAAIRLPYPGTDAFANLGKVLVDLGRPEEAVAYLQLVLRDNPDFHEGRAQLARVHAELERWEDAVEGYRACLRAGYGGADLHNDLGRALFRLGRLEEARDEMRAALALEPGHALATQNLATIDRILAQGR